MVGDGKSGKGNLLGDKPNCFVDDKLNQSATTKTVVVVRNAGTCQDNAHQHMGVVIYDGAPVAWGCLSEDEIEDFTAWCDDNFETTHHVEVTQPIGNVNCPPPTATEAVRAAAAAQMRSILGGFAPSWQLLAVRQTAA